MCWCVVFIDGLIFWNGFIVRLCIEDFFSGLYGGGYIKGNDVIVFVWCGKG